MAESTRGGHPVRSAIARASATEVQVHGLDLVEMLGEVSLGDFAYLELFARLPDTSESRLFNAIVVALVEHGLTPSALVSRLTIMGAPESLQGAVAAGLLLMVLKKLESGIFFFKFSMSLSCLLFS